MGWSIFSSLNGTEKIMPQTMYVCKAAGMALIVALMSFAGPTPASAQRLCIYPAQHGTWVNTNRHTRSIVYLKIRYSCSSQPRLRTVRRSLTLQVWARCGGGLCGWGTARTAEQGHVWYIVGRFYTGATYRVVTATRHGHRLRVRVYVKDRRTGKTVRYDSHIFRKSG